MDTTEINSLTKRAIGCAYSVHNTLGPGFLEKVYENALRIELEEAGLIVAQQKPIPVLYRGRTVGEFFADLFVDNRLIVELKAIRQLAQEHEVQLVNYLAATGIDDGLLINFGPSVKVRRKYRLLDRDNA
ncbi:MAG: GxxExxY protein [Pirellulales bacterium]|nr:GxxExxY protein [Pirellulales bacterium]